MRVPRRPGGLLLLATVLGACEGPPSLASFQPALILPQEADRSLVVAPPLPELGGAPEAQLPPRTVAPPGVALPPLPGQKATGSGGPPTLPAALVRGDGQVLSLGPVDQVSLQPQDFGGQLTLLAIGRVPSSLLLEDGPVGQSHPSRQDGEVVATQSAQVQLPAGGLGPEFSAALWGPPGAATQANASGGAYQLELPIRAASPGLLVLRAQAPERVAVAELELSPGQSQSLATPSVQAAQAFIPPPALPPGLRLAGSSTWLVRPDGRRALLWAGAPGPAPRFQLPLTQELHQFSAISPDGREGSTVLGAPGQLPSFPLPPQFLDLEDRVPQPGELLRWRPVPGALAYSLRLHNPEQGPGVVWEGLSDRPYLQLPDMLLPLGDGWRLRLDAWLGDGHRTYDLAQAPSAQTPRALRLPAQPRGPNAAVCWTQVGPGVELAPAEELTP